jgi:sterol desaturase/sphingolipid hydroxylase (fatty acid hydroxylase superfamily)
MKLKSLIKLIAVPAAIGAIGLLTLLEKRRPLRKTVEPKEKRLVRNLLMAVSASAAMILFEKPAIDFFTKFVENHKIGLLKIVKLPPAIETFLAVILLDYTLYLWHVSTHKVPFLWRFHLVHHVDLDLDSSTAYRFHFGEITISVLWRIMQILLIGASPQAVKTWQILLFPAVLFHHSNLNLPDGLDERLSQFIITPKLHGIHHSAIQEETDSNWSSILSVWDRLHGTLRTDVNQSEITIGVPAFQNPNELNLINLLELPFQEQKESWKLTAGNSEV